MTRDLKPLPPGKIRLGADAPDRLAQNWAYRCLVETRRAYESSGGDDPLFLILQAAMKLTPTAYPFFEQFGVRDENHRIRTNRYTGESARDTAYDVCSDTDLKDNLMRLAMALKLPDDHIRGLYALVQRWVRYDDTPGQANLAHERLPGTGPKQERLH
jgi:hypothetical protein